MRLITSCVAITVLLAAFSACGAERTTPSEEERTVIAVADSFMAVAMRMDWPAAVGLVADTTELSALEDWNSEGSSLSRAYAIHERCEVGVSDTVGWVNYQLTRESCDPYFQVLLTKRGGLWLVRSTAPSPD